VNKSTKIFVWFLAVGVSLAISYEFFIIIESPFGFMTPNNLVTLFEDVTLKPDESYTHSVKTTQGFYHGMMVVSETGHCPKLEILDENGEFLFTQISTICHIDLSNLEKDSIFQIRLTNTNNQDMTVFAKYTYDDRISWVSDYLPRHGVFLDLIGYSIMIIGGIIFGIGKLQSKLKNST
jgi:hypothetical protein